MIIEGDSDIIMSCEYEKLPSGDSIQYLSFRNGAVLAITVDAMAFYKDRQSIEDPLGNGLLDMVEITPDIKFAEQGCVKEYRAGYIGLIDERVILITPNDIQLFVDKPSALRNQNVQVQLSLSSTNN